MQCLRKFPSGSIIIGSKLLLTWGQHWHKINTIPLGPLWILLKISLKFVLKVRVSNIPALVWVMVLCLPGAKPLSEPIMAILLTHHSASIGARRHTDETRLQRQQPQPAVMKTSSFPVYLCLPRVTITPLIWDILSWIFSMLFILGSMVSH